MVPSVKSRKGLNGIQRPRGFAESSSEQRQGPRATLREKEAVSTAPAQSLLTMSSLVQHVVACDWREGERGWWLSLLRLTAGL